VLVFGGEGVVLRQQGLVLGGLGQLGGQLGQLMLHLMEPGKGGVQYVFYGVSLGVDGDLGDESHPAALGKGNGAAVGDKLPAEHPKEGGLARAVVAQQTHPFPGVHLEGDVFKDILPHLKAMAQVCDG
jgi:hypothetical protein